MNPRKVTEVLAELLKQRWPIFIWGPPGAGKSSVVSEVASNNGFRVIDIRAPLLDPTDLRGIPTIEEGIARWCPPSFLPTEEESGILFFDELNAAPPMVQASLYQLTLDGRIGDYVLPSGWRIVAAGNRSEDRSVVFRMPAALANRFVHLDFEISFEDWRQWAVAHQIHPLVTGFLSLRSELLFDMSIPERGFPTPRSWEMASDTIQSIGTRGHAADVLLGIVGAGAAVEFLAYCETAMTEKQVEAIIKEPKTAKLPEEIGNLYALVSYLATRAKDKGAREASSVLLARLLPELAVLLLRDILRAYPKFIVESSAARKFVAERSDLILE